jgi:hypothetical protein
MLLRRHPKALVVLLLVLAVTVAALACGSSSSGLTCGEGTVARGATCIAALEAGAEASAVDGGDAGPAGDGPTGLEGAVDGAAAIAFGGPTAVAPASDSELLVVWDAGADPSSPSALRYRVYVGPASGPVSYAMPSVTTAAGAVDAVVGGLKAGVTYSVGVRAVNAAGTTDQNDVQLKGAPQSDSVAPMFAGLASAKPGGSGAVALSWPAAKDALTPAAAMRYLVYVGVMPGTEDFSQPDLVTSPGALTATVTGLPGVSVPRYFVVRSRDAAGNVDSNVVELASNPGPDVVAPVFGGCTSATLTSAVAAAVAWQPATDDTSPQANLTYDVFLSKTAGQYDFTQPFVSVLAQTEVLIPALSASTRYYFVCRAKDQAGNEDTNTVEVSLVTGNDPTPPAFAGISGFAPNPVSFSATLSWMAATDLVTPSSMIVYDVYEAAIAAGEIYTQPPQATSAPGATSITLTGLTPNATLFFVVRARDLDGNHDANTVEVSFTTNVSFSQNVQPILTTDCGVVGCHVPGNPTGGLILAPGFAYGQTVSVLAGEGHGLLDGGGSMAYINPGDPLTSYLNVKINAPLIGAYQDAGFHVGTQMPAPSTGSTLTQGELDTIGNWIAQGAGMN